MSINLNNEEFDGGSDVVIFNGGTAGVAENITVSLEKKKADDKDKSPDYKLVFKDANGGTCNLPFWYVTDPTQWKTVEELIAAQGKVLKHIAHAILGDGYKFPEFANATQMLDGVMKLVKGGIKPGLTFRVFVNYGTPKSVKKYIQPRTWVPFMESMKVAIEDTRLKQGDFDAMERLKADNFNPNQSSSTSSDDGDDDEDW